MDAGWLLAAVFLMVTLLVRSEVLRQSDWFRMFFSICVGLLSLRYILWRWTAPLPSSLGLWAQAYCYIFLLFESANLLNSLISIFWLSKTINRSGTVDQRRGSWLLNQPVDVFIPTYNESLEILERTILGARNIRHVDMRVWVLDDGNRPSVRALADELGCYYLARIKGKHAKAGNINNGLEHALKTGRKPAFIVVFDADFVAHATFLQRTLPLFQDEDVGIVQTPQHFFNKDPVQNNLKCTDSWPDEQRFFFNYLMASKDAWGSAFCCGTGAVMRTEALIAAGGMATATVTEDMLTSFAMREHGYRTILLNERLSLGLAPEGLSEYVSQRCRWALGAIQQIHTRWAPWGRAPVGWANRLSCLDGLLFWSIFFQFKLLVISAPAVFWFTQVIAINAPLPVLVHYMGPFWIANLCYLAVYSGKTILPIMGEVNLLILAPSISRSVFQGLFKPFGQPFKVTAKGVTSSGTVVHWGIMAPFLTILILTLMGVLGGLDPFSWSGQAPTPLALVWTLISVIILVATCGLCVEPAQRREHERFASNEPVTLLSGMEKIAGHLLDISIGGARAQCHGSRPLDVQEVVLERHGLRVPVKGLSYYEDGTIGLQFGTDTITHRRLILLLFTGGYAQDDLHVSITGTMRGWWRKIFA